jgi:hypothetical protein
VGSNIEPYDPDPNALDVETFSSNLTAYLDSVQLPKEGVLVPVQARRPVFQKCQWC